MFPQELSGFGIRGYKHYDWKPKPKERLICECPEDCVIVLKRVAEGKKQVGTVPTELQTVFKDFLIHGGSIDATCTSATYRRSAKKGKEIMVSFKLKGSNTQHPLKIAFDKLKTVVNELGQNDTMIKLAPVQVTKKKPSPSKSSSRKGDFASPSQQKLPTSQSSSRKKKASTKERSDPEESLEESEGEEVNQKTRREIKYNAKGANTRSDSDGNDEELTAKNINQKKKVKTPTGNRNCLLDEIHQHRKCVDNRNHKQQNLFEEDGNETDDEGSREGGIEPEKSRADGEKNDQSERKALSDNNRSSDGHHYAKKEDDTVSETLANNLTNAMKSVGQLIFNSREIGTVFRVGSTYLMTARHVVMKIIDPEDTGKVSTSALNDREVYVFFNESACVLDRKVYHLRDYVRYDTALDFAILDISDPDQDLPKALELDNKENTCLKRVWLLGFGHPDSPRKHQDPCTILSPTSSQVQDAIRSFQCNSTTYSTKMKWAGTNLQLVDRLIRKGFLGYDNPEKLLMHSYIQHGGSGSPVLARKDSHAVQVVGIFTSGIPEFYFDLPEQLQNSYNKEHRFEEALKMNYVFDSIRKKDSELASNIFFL